jgi:hypothetical protein
MWNMRETSGSKPDRSHTSQVSRDACVEVDPRETKAAEDLSGLYRVEQLRRSGMNLDLKAFLREP